MNGRTIAVGADRLMVELGLSVGAFADDAARLADEGKTPLYVALDGRLAAILAVADPLKETSRDAIRQLKAMA